MSGHVVPEPVRRLWGLPEGPDLPPSWDGVAVSWAGWRPALGGSLDWHLPIEDRACDQCGSLGGRLHNSGARKATAASEGWAGPVRDLFASRCADCGHDRVWDAAAELHWDLGPEDYLPPGSVDPGAPAWQPQMF